MTTPPDLPRGLREALLVQSGTTSASSSCLDDLTVAGLAEGSLPVGLRITAVAHLAACPACRTAVAAVARALSDPEVAKEFPPSDRRIRRYGIPIGVAAAAVLALAVLGLPRATEPDGAGTHREPTIAGAAIPELVSPVGRVAAVPTLRWSSVTGAERYRVTLYNESGQVVYEVEPADTIAALPDSLRLIAGRRYLWKVDARIGFDRWVSSRLVEFELAGDPGRQ